MKGDTVNAVPKHTKKHLHLWQAYVIISVISVVVYVNGLEGNFVHDDIPAVIMNRDVLALDPIGHAFKNDFWGTPMANLDSHKSYRPLTVLTFRLNYLYFALQPFWFHVTNVIFHAFSTVLFAKVCQAVARLKLPFVLLAGILFAVHPVHTEAVTGIVGRADVLACIFFLLSFLAYHGNICEKYHVWTSIACGALGMLAKETGITVFLLNISFDFYLHWKYIKRSIKQKKLNSDCAQFCSRMARMITSVGILLALRLAILQGSLPTFGVQDNPAAFHPSLHVRFLTFCYLVAFNWWLLLCPTNLSHDWQMGSIPLVTSGGDSRNFFTCFFGGILLLLLARCFRNFEDRKRTPLVLALMLLVFPFIPASNLILTVGFVVAERVLYIPSLGCTLLVVYGIQELIQNYSKHRQTIQCFVLLLILASIFRTITRNRDWRSRETLLRAGLQTLPQNAKMHYNYANYLKDTSKFELAKSHYYTALKLWPSYASAHNNLGTILNNDSEAEKHFLTAIHLSQNHLNAHYNLGKLYRKFNRTYESEKMLKKCTVIDEKFTYAYLELAKLRTSTFRETTMLLKKVVDLNPMNPYYCTLLGKWLYSKGSFKKALEYLYKSIEASPSYERAMWEIFRIFRRFGHKSRLFQAITRWHLIKRNLHEEMLLSSNIYLHDWSLKNEVRYKANEYNSTSLNKGATSETLKERKCERSLSMDHREKSNLKNSTMKLSHKNFMPFMISHLLDKV